MASAKDFLGNTYINAESLEGKRWQCKIIAAGPDETSEGKVKLCIELDKFPDLKLALNKTNLKRLIKAFGDDFSKWKGKQVNLYLEDVSFQGRDVQGVRVDAKK